VEGEELEGLWGGHGNEWSNCGEVRDVMEGLWGGQGRGVGPVGRWGKG